MKSLLLYITKEKTLSASTFPSLSEEMNRQSIRNSLHMNMTRCYVRRITSCHHWWDAWLQEISSFGECATTKRRIISSSAPAIKRFHQVAVTGYKMWSTRGAANSWAGEMQAFLCKGAMKLHCNIHCSLDLVCLMHFLMIKQETAKRQQCPSQVSFLPSLNDKSDGTGTEHATESRLFLFAVIWLLSFWGQIMRTTKSVK